MKNKLRILIREHMTRLLEGFVDDDDYLSTFEFEDIPDMQPGGKAHSRFLKDLKKDQTFGSYKDPSDKELENIVKSLRQANLDLPGDKELIHQAQEQLDRELNPMEIEKIKTAKRKMDQLWSVGSYN